MPSWALCGRFWVNRSLPQNSGITAALLARVLSSCGLRRTFQFVALPLWAVVGLWRSARARRLLGFSVGGTLLQRRLGFLARFDVIDRPGFLTIRTAAL